MVFWILIAFLGLGTFWVPIYYCAVFALPVFVALSAAFWAMNSGGGLGSILVGLAAGVIVFVIGRFVFSRSRSLVVRWIIVLLFALPAAVAGYSLVLQLSELGVPSAVWRHALAIVGAMIIGVTAMMQVEKSAVEIPNRSRPS